MDEQSVFPETCAYGLKSQNLGQNVIQQFLHLLLGKGTLGKGTLGWGSKV